ncbi:MAG: response regulator [Synechococcales cyanobacterium RU_4_20]|nr:response regulator [Synechococcales cyanobacterium RU_4_20]NJR69467.1 response regulator [Synechococcales cyanobacterium CRU_2_2]
MNTAILCVDDEILILDTLKEQLQRNFGQQYIYEMAESAGEAWEIIEELCDSGIRLLVIVSDWLMPGIKGDEFLIQVHQKLPQIMTVMLTGQADQSAIKRARQEANLHTCLHKPWRESELVTLISKTLK